MVADRGVEQLFDVGDALARPNSDIPRYRRTLDPRPIGFAAGVLAKSTSPVPDWNSRQRQFHVPWLRNE